MIPWKLILFLATLVVLTACGRRYEAVGGRLGEFLILDTYTGNIYAVPLPAPINNPKDFAPGSN